MTTRIGINWAAYYAEFSRVHGGSPVLYRQDKDTGKGGYLLFRDGWMYSPTDYTGPEYAPLNKEDCFYKMRQYWLIRERVLALDLRELKSDALELARLQDSRSATMLNGTLGVVHTMVTESDLDDSGRKISRQKSVSVDLDWLVAKIRDLTNDVAQCRKEREKLTPPPVEQSKLNAALMLAEMELVELKVSRNIP